MWIESHVELARHPKVLRLCARLNKPLPETIGYLHLLWWWTATYRIAGDLTGVSPWEISTAAGWQGEANLFVNALVSERWLDRKGKKLIVHDWYDYCGKLIRARLDRAGQKQELLSPARELLRPEKGSTNKTQQTTQTTPTIPTIPTIPTSSNVTLLLKELGFTVAGVRDVMCNRELKTIIDAIRLSEGKRNRPGFITDALKKGWVK